MELKRAFLETWVSENIERTSDTEKITTSNELWATFLKDSVPSLEPQRDARGMVTSWNPQVFHNHHYWSLLVKRNLVSCHRMASSWKECKLTLQRKRHMHLVLELAHSGLRHNLSYIFLVFLLQTLICNTLPTDLWSKPEQCQSFPFQCSTKILFLLGPI